jgi:hypothetical protein
MPLTVKPTEVGIHVLLIATTKDVDGWATGGRSFSGRSFMRTIY